MRRMLILCLAALAAEFAVAAPAQIAPRGDPAAGARQFLQCRACHSVVQNAPNTIGPNLWGIVGAKAASRPAFAYSPALKKSGVTWTTAELEAFIARPNQKVPRTKMAFAGVSDPAARRNLVAYLATMKR